MDATPAAATPWTVARLLAWTREHFERRGLESPRLCAEILLAHAMQCERLRLFTQHENVPAEAVLARFRDHVQQAAAGRPIAYLTGTKDFFSLAFEVTPDVLIPRPDTEVLVERTIDLVRKSRTPDGETPAEPISILDLGTGSGCIAIALARHLPDAQLFASDASAAALTIARRNAEKHALTARIEFAHGDLFDAWPPETRWDVIVSNPPYIATNDPDLAPNVRDNEPPAALFAGPDGLAILRRIIAATPARLNPGGALLLENAYNQAPAVRDLLTAAGFEGVVSHRDTAGIERVTQGRRSAQV